uniref:Uncharacterized protein n=1 Tax=Labrus bergylta TaxID=56723 RepID=A0A3Q3EBJ7_9LABR
DKMRTEHQVIHVQLPLNLCFGWKVSPRNPLSSPSQDDVRTAFVMFINGFLQSGPIRQVSPHQADLLGHKEAVRAVVGVHHGEGVLQPVGDFLQTELKTAIRVGLDPRGALWVCGLFSYCSFLYETENFCNKSMLRKRVYSYCPAGGGLKVFEPQDRT